MFLELADVQVAFWHQLQTGADPLEAMTTVLFERLTEREGREYLRLMRDIVNNDGIRDFSPAYMFSVAQTACFNLEAST
jgi:hypothetical protein